MGVRNQQSIIMKAPEVSAPRTIIYVTIFNWCTDDVNLGFILDFKKYYEILTQEPHCVRDHWFC